MAGDALDDLLDADIDIFRDVDTNMEIPERRRASPGIGGGEKSLGLGIDEEIKIARKRKPIVKLDETRFACKYCTQFECGRIIDHSLGFCHKLGYQS